MTAPKLISVDDHVVEPPDLWVRYLPERFRAAAPHVERLRGGVPRVKPTGPAGSVSALSAWAESEDGDWSDIWIFEDLKMPIMTPFAASGLDQNATPRAAMTYDDMRPGCYEQRARLADMDENWTEASLSFPTVPRFCGQTFLERGSCELGLACVQAYNDWMIDDWCAGDGYGRLIPLTLVPLWDPELAAVEVRRCAEKGSHAISFSENPTALGLPSIHTQHWDPMFAACEDTDTVVNLHIGSSSTFPLTSYDAPAAVSLALTYQGSAHAFCDWLSSGVFERFGSLRMALSEGQVGWMAFLLERLDNVWNERAVLGGLDTRLTRPPSSYIPDRLFGCIYDDIAGLLARDVIGIEQIMFEIDYPHGDSTWPNSAAVFEKGVVAAGLDDHEAYLVARGNAIRCYGLQRFGIDK